MDETDLFFNLRLGEVVLQTGRVPTENLLSFTYPSATDINLAWLFQVVLALAHRAAGVPGTVLLKTALCAAAWALLFRVALRRGAAPALAALSLALAAWAAEPRFVERPHLVTFLGLAALLLALERAESGRPRLLWGMIPVGLVWANGNSCFFLAPAVLLLYAAGAALDELRPHARRAVWVALAMLPLPFATPSGWRWLSYVANHFLMPYVRPLQEYRQAEWPLDGPFFFLMAGVGLALALVLLSARPGWRWTRWRRKDVIPARVLLPLVALGALGAFRIRFVAEFSMLAGPALAVVATRLLPRAVFRWRWLGLSAAALLITVAMAPRASAVAVGEPALDLGIERDLVPFSAIHFVEEHGLRDRMYNDLEVGSYLTWHGWPRYRVFQDPRINGYPDELHAVLRRPDLSRQEWQGLMDRFAVKSALITYPSVNPRGALFDPRLWALVYRANDGLVFARRGLPVADRLAEIPLTFTFSTANGLEPVPMLAKPEQARVAPCDWQHRLGDHHRSEGDARAARERYEEAVAVAAPGSSCARSARRSLGITCLELGDVGRAAELLEGESDSVARTNHGYALLGMHQAAAALADFDAVLADAPASDEASLGRALSLLALGRRAESLTLLQRLAERSPSPVIVVAANRKLDELLGRRGAGSP